MKISLKYAVFVFICFIALCGYLFLSFYREAKHESIKNLKTEQSLHARQAAKGIEDFFTDWTTIMVMLSETSHIKAMDSAGKENIKRLYKENSEFIRAITRVDASGKIVYTIPYDQSVIGKDISSQKHIKEIMRTHKPVVSDVFFAVQGYNMVALHVPVFINNKYQGAIGIGINFQSLAKRYIEGIKIGKTGYAWLISRDGTELFCPVPGHVGKSVFENCKNFPSILSMAEEMIKGHAGDAIYTFDKIRGDTVENIRKHAVYMPIFIGNTFWSVVVASSEDEMISSLKNFRNRLVVIICVILLGGVLFSYFWSKAIYIIKEEKQRRVAEEALHTSERELKALFKSMINAFALFESVFDGNGNFISYRFVSVNDAFERITGLKKEDVQSRTIHEVWPGTEDGWIEACGEVAVSGVPSSFEMYHGPTDKTYYCSVYRPGEDNDRFCIIFDDVTEKKKAEEMLKQSEAKFSKLFMSSPFAAVLTGLDDGTVLEANDVFFQIMGYTRDEVIGKPALKLKNWLNIADREKFIKILKEKGNVDQMETLFRAKDERIVPALISGRLIEINGATCVFSITTDITERKIAEENFRISEAKYRNIFENAVEGIFQTTPDDRYLSLNPALARILGYESPGEVMENITDVAEQIYVVPKNREVFKEVLDKKGVIQGFETQLYRKDKSRVWVSMNARSVCDENGKVLYYEGTVEDIAKRKQIQEKLQRSEATYRTIFENSGTAMIIIDSDTTIMLCNEEWVKLSGFTREECEGKKGWTEFVHEEDLKHMLEYHDKRRVDPHYAPRKYEFRYVDRFGNVYNMINTVAMIPGTRMSVAAQLDITDIRRLESQLLQSQKMEAIGTLAGGIAHDFNNILSAIMGYTNLLQMKVGKDEPLNSYLKQILISTEKAASLTQSLLAFSRKQFINPRPLDLNDAVTKAFKLLSRLITEDIELKVTLDPEKMTVMADSGQIDQVIINLVTNARDAMPKGGMLEISTKKVHLDNRFVSTHGFGSTGDYAVISIADNGTGIDVKIKEKIFEPFFTTKEIGKGTGLGLSIVYGIVRQHNGFVDLFSEPGRGTTFLVYFPLTEKETEKKRELSEDIPGGTETLLLAEDNADLRTLTKTFLGQNGYTVVEAVDGNEAISKFFEHMPDLTILDVVMPKKNGKEVYDQIKKENPNVKILFTSGYTDDIVYQKGIMEEGLDFISKPFSPYDFLRAIRRILDKT